MRVHGHQGETIVELVESTEFTRGHTNARLDAMENAHYASVRGNQAPSNVEEFPKELWLCPSYVDRSDEWAYFLGYEYGIALLSDIDGW